MNSRYDLIFPKSPIILLQGEACGRCGHPLPDTLLHHIVTPDSALEIREAAISGTLNSCRCTYCDFLGYLASAVWVTLPERNRQVFIFPTFVIIPNLKPVAQNLIKLARQHDLASEICFKLPCQKAQSCFDIPDLLRTPDSAVEYEQRAEDQLINRLILSPENRAARFVVEQVESFRSQMANVRNCESANGASIQIAYIALFSSFERTDWGLRTIILELERVLANPANTDISHLLVQFRDNVKSTYTKKWGEFHRELVLESSVDVADALATLELALSKRQGSIPAVEISELLPLIYKFHACKQDELALDLAKYYLHHVSPEDARQDILEVLLFFGVLLERTGEWSNYESWEYLMLAASRLPKRGESDDPHAVFLAAVAREYISRFYQREQKPQIALRMIIEAAELYLDAGHPKQAEELAEKAVLLGQDLDDPETVKKASLVLSQVSDKTVPVNKSAPTGEPIDIQSQIDAIQESEHFKIRHMIINVLPPGKEWDGMIIEGWGIRYGDLVIKKAPVNYDPRHQLSLYEAKTIDIECFFPQDQNAINQYIEGFTSKDHESQYYSIVLRIWEREGDGLSLRDEQLVRHRLLRWAEEGTDDNERWERYTNIRPALWKWAGERRCVLWLLKEYAIISNQARESDKPLSIEEKIGFGLGFGRLSRSSKSHGETHQQWLATETIKLLGEFVGSDGEGLSGDTLLLPSAAFEVRSTLAGAFEVNDDIDHAISLYAVNIRAALQARKLSRDFDGGVSIQSMAGADIGRYIRALLRRSEWKLSDADLRRLFLFGELTSARSLTEAYLMAKSSIEPRYKNLEYEQRNIIEKSLTRYADDALGDPYYTQLILITSHDRFEGSWTSLTPTRNFAPTFRKIEWNTPQVVYQEIDKFYSYHASIREIVKKERRQIISCFHNAKSWVKTVLSEYPVQASNMAKVSQRFGIRCQSYLISFPWSFLSSLLNFEAKDEFRLPISIVSAFSYASLKFAEESEAHTIGQRKLAVFLDPLEDLPEVKHVANRLRSGLENVEADLLLGTQVTVPRFIEYLNLVDCVVYIGHGRQLREQESASIICSYGKEVRDVDIENANLQKRNTTQVAVIMTCWGGTSAITQSMHSWEPYGLPYSLKKVGFDYIVTSLWPVSPRMATSFVEYFLEGWSQGLAISTSVSTAYQRLIEKYGVETVMIEGSGIQLIA